VDRLELNVDVTEAAGLGEKAMVGVTVDLPALEDLCVPPVVCFAKPGAGFSRGYFTSDLPGPGAGSQACWHASHGWVFVAVDHLGTASQAAEQAVLCQLRQGTLRRGFAPIEQPVILGIGQSMGGCMTVAQQGRYHCYDGIAVLGFSAVHTDSPVPPGGNADFVSSMNWLYFYDDVNTDELLSSLPGMAAEGQLPPWASGVFPGIASSVTTPGVIAPEAAAVKAPVLVAMGERDVIPDPKGEPTAYLSAASIDLYICPRMAHMHNFAGTRELLWRRIETWAGWVANLKQWWEA
jgi:hypothetical protein